MRRLALLVASALLAVLALAAPASAHVSVSAQDATAGGDAVLTFRVPTESDTASTTKVEVHFPQQYPLASVSVQPVPGWNHTITTAKLATPIKTDDGDVSEAVSTITWTATAGGIRPGEFQQFPVSAGPLPEADTISFATIQTYSDGTVVSWNETAAPGSTSEPEHPAPTLTLTKPAAPATSAKRTSNAGPYALSIVALVLAAAALGLTVVGRAKARQER